MELRGWWRTARQSRDSLRETQHKPYKILKSDDFLFNSGFSYKWNKYAWSPIIAADPPHISKAGGISKDRVSDLFYSITGNVVEQPIQHRYKITENLNLVSGSLTVRCPCKTRWARNSIWRMTQARTSTFWKLHLGTEFQDSLSCHTNTLLKGFASLKGFSFMI